MTWIIGLETEAIEFSNAFAQDDLKTPPVYMNFHTIENLVLDTLLRLKKSIYGQSEALRLWFEKLSIGIEDRGFKTSIAYPFMFISDKVICLVYVDDFLWFDNKQEYINEVIDSFHVDGDKYNW